MGTRIVSWNVNGIRACASKGFLDWLPTARADVIGLQEVRAGFDDLPAEIRSLRDYPHATWTVASSRRGYSGVSLLSRVAPRRVVTSLGKEDFDCEGRFVLAEFDTLLVANAYFPNGSGNQRDNGRVPFKLAFTEHVFRVVARERARTKKPAVIMGDFNTAPHPIDLARPKDNVKTSGFLPEERAALARCLGRTWVDSYRALHPERVQYSWWSSRFGVREKNIGWRIDHVMVSAELHPRLRDAFIWDTVRGSDHCPVGADLDLALALA